MKANELMIGDWVMLDRNYPVLSKSPVKITWYDLDRIRYGRECVPILLTAEILEKNGWVDYDEELHYNESKINFYLLKYGASFGINMGYDYSREEFAIIRYVHELQHALRLCGLNELADNFKV